MKIKLYLLFICLISSIALSGCKFFDQFTAKNIEPAKDISMGEKKDAGSGFFKDDYKVYNPSKCLSDEYLNKLDPASFQVLSECFVKDNNNVYYRPFCGHDCNYAKHEKADAGTLENLKDGFLRDKNYIYNMRGKDDKIIAEADLYSFSILGYDFSSDKNNIYYENIKLADNGSTTAEIIDQNKIKIGDDTFMCLSDMFGPRCRIYIPDTATTTPETDLNECEKAGGQLSEKEECDNSKSAWCVISSEEECYADALIDGKCPVTQPSPKVLCDNESKNNDQAVSPEDLSDTCEFDSDCATTIYPANSCCYGCPRPMNKDSINILEKWRKNNCSGFDVKNECPELDCSSPKKSTCEDNKCQFEE